MKKKFQIAESNAVCNDCAWECTEINSQGQAAMHARRKKHRVFVSVTLKGEYDGRQHGKK